MNARIKHWWNKHKGTIILFVIVYIISTLFAISVIEGGYSGFPHNIYEWIQALVIGPVVIVILFPILLILGRLEEDIVHARHMRAVDARRLARAHAVLDDSPIGRSILELINDEGPKRIDDLVELLQKHESVIIQSIDLLSKRGLVDVFVSRARGKVVHASAWGKRCLKIMRESERRDRERRGLEELKKKAERLRREI